MALSRERMLDRMLARDRAYDGRFLTGVVSTGIYCLPSCPAKNPKPENVRFFHRPEEARRAGLRPCKRCRPDDFYRRHDPDLALLESLVARMRREPAAFADVAAVARSAGLGSSKLHELCRRHFHSTPARLLADARGRVARRLLLETGRSVADIAFEVGWESLSSFHASFSRSSFLTPLAYRRTLGARELELRLPAAFRRQLTLAYLGRDPQGPTQRVDGSTFVAGAWLNGAAPPIPVRIEVAIGPGRARCRVEAAGRGGRLPDDAAPRAHAEVLRRLGLTADPAPFERRVRRDPALARIVPSGRRGLRIPLVGDAFHTLVWAVLGQQVSLRFARTLHRRLVERVAPAVGGPGEVLFAPPTAEVVATLEPRQLVGLGLSRSKADYLLGVARAAAGGELPLAALGEGTATRAERALLELRGLGPWSAHYVMMRGLGFADCLPVGDAGLGRSLVRFFRLEGRPGPQETRSLMAPFAPYRSFATFHLWQMLEDRP